MRALPAALAVLVALGACESKRGPEPSPSASPSTAGSPTGSAPVVSSAPLRPRPTVACRALSVSGGARTASGPLATGGTVDGKTWLELESGASVSFRHSQSARELTLTGPGRALPCVDGGEDVLLAQGGLRSAAGPGARPGAQVTIYLPLGTVSYGDARIDIRASEKRAEIAVRLGEAWVVPSEGARRAGPESLAAPKGKATLTGTPSAKDLVAACEKLAEDAERRMVAVLGPGDGGPDAGSLGDRAAAHAAARRSARAACWSARASAALVQDAARRDLELRLERADRRWQAVSTPGPAVKPSSG